MIEPNSLEFTLISGQSVRENKRVSISALPLMADIIFSFDLTGSMAGIINLAKARAADIINQLNSLGIDINYGVISYMDYPHAYDSYGYSALYGSVANGDYPYRLDQSITGDTALIIKTIGELSLGWGADGPQDYTRIFYESYADPNIVWRSGAKRFLVNFADSVPHDNNINEGVPGQTEILSTGGDPGRDEIMFTEDDLDLQTVLREMSKKNIVLLEGHTTGYRIEYWKYWSSLTGGDALEITTDNFVADIVNGIKSSLETTEVNQLHLKISPGYEQWLESVSPPFYSGPVNVTVDFEIILQVPEGTKPGRYTFLVTAVDDREVSYGEQIVVINLVEAVQISRTSEFGMTQGIIREVVATGRLKKQLLNTMKQIQFLVEEKNQIESALALSTNLDNTIIMNMQMQRIQMRLILERLAILQRYLIAIYDIQQEVVSRG
jgi:hypothetical protein